MSRLFRDVGRSRKTIARFLLWGGLLITALTGLRAAPVRADEPLLFISSFAPGHDGAIHAYRFDSATGQLHSAGKTTSIEHPFFLALSPDKKFLYSIHAKQFGSKEPEQVAAYALVGRTGELTPLNRQSSRGTASCSLDVDATGKTLFVANYTSGDIASLPIRSNGSLDPAATFIQHTGTSVDKSRQNEPHAHCILVSPDNRFVLVADLGIDKILIYALDPATSKLTPHRQPFVRTPPGAGPRHLVFSPDGKKVYAVNELGNSVTWFDYDPLAGLLAERQTISTVPTDFKGVSHCADLKITPDGKYLYATNRGHDSIACYKIGAEGELALLAIEPSLGKGPQNLAIPPGGKWLLCANMPGNNIAIFQIDPETGKIKSAREPVTQTSPSCIMIVP